MRLQYAFLFAVFAGCADPELQRAMDPGNDLPLGDQLAGDEKADGAWGAALTCKDLPPVDALTALSYLAAKTSRVRLGTGIIQLHWDNPVLVAQRASLVAEMFEQSQC